VFAVYHPQHGSALAQGGRYDGVGEVFGHARAATGFDVNPKQLLSATGSIEPLVFAPLLGSQMSEEVDQRQALQEVVRDLRSKGRRVRSALTEDEPVPDECTALLVRENGNWQVVERQSH
jgi:ATP phosphoribosyltransferase regulatory subunit